MQILADSGSSGKFAATATYYPYWLVTWVNFRLHNYQRPLTYYAWYERAFKYMVRDAYGASIGNANSDSELLLVRVVLVINYALHYCYGV